MPSSVFAARSGRAQVAPEELRRDVRHQPHVVEARGDVASQGNEPGERAGEFLVRVDCGVLEGRGRQAHVLLDRLETGAGRVHRPRQIRPDPVRLFRDKHEPAVKCQTKAVSERDLEKSIKMAAEKK